ncbi:MAG: GGDEF domain-containing protein [Rubrobacteraceae bacterium]
MDRTPRIADEVRGNVPDILELWREARGGRGDTSAPLVESMGRLVEVFSEFIQSPDSVETFSRGGEVRGLVRRTAEHQRDSGRDAVGVMEDFVVLRQSVWRLVEQRVDLSEFDGREVSAFFVKMMQASDWLTERGLESYDAIARDEMQKALGQAAATDLLTGLPDRERFNRLLLPRAIEDHERFCLAIFDVVKFSETVAGGEMDRARETLMSLSKAIKDGLPEDGPEDAVCSRFGDDEISVILPGLGEEGAYDFAERVLQGLEETGADFEVDVGISEYPTHGADAGQLVRETVKALGMAKRVGGRGIVVAR